MTRPSRSTAAAVGLLRHLRSLPAFFPEYSLVGRPREADVVLAHAEDRHLSALMARFPGREIRLVEYGLLRAIGPASPAALTVSVMLRSRHEAGLAALAPDFDLGAELLDNARPLMVLKRRLRLARCNWAPHVELPGRSGRSRVVVVDRTNSDGFLGAPILPDAHYRRMLSTAREENPGSSLVILRAPSISALSDEDLRPEDLVLDRPVDTLSLAEQADVVYTVSGLLGWEAQLLDRRCVCFGAPFFSGWGFTDDRFATPHERPRSVEEVFAAAYLLLPRYVDPLSQQPCSMDLALARLSALDRHGRRVAGAWAGVNIPPAKTPILKAFLEGPRSTYSARPTSSVDRLAIWPSRPNAASRAAEHASADAVTYVEDGFVRSAGLGSSFTPAQSLVLDRQGIYYDPTSRSDLEQRLEQAEFDGETLDLARRLIAAIRERRLSKYNLQDEVFQRPPVDPARTVILAPGQVENDASVVTGGAGWTNRDLLRAIRSASPNAFIIYKEHPDVSARNRPGRLTREQHGLADLVVRHVDILRCIEASDEVHTLTSLTGFEALLRDKPVVTYGWPFYAGWGLTLDRGPEPRPARTARRSLEELVAAALIEYPLYLDPVSWLPCDPLTFVERLADRVTEGVEPPVGPAMRYIRALRYMIAPRKPPRY